MISSKVLPPRINLKIKFWINIIARKLPTLAKPFLSLMSTVNDGTI